MPVSPQDFALWSNLTGNPYPRTPSERMMLAPQVHMFNQDLARGKNPLGQAVEGVGSAIDFAGRAALGVGLLAGAGLLAGKYIDSRKDKVAAPQAQMKLELDNEPEVGLTVAEAAPDVTSRVAQVSGDVTRSTTSQNFNQNEVGLQTTEAQLARGTSPAKPTVVDSESKPATQSEVIATGQPFSPGTELDQLAAREVPHTPVRDRADDLIAEFLGGVAAEQRAQKRIDQSVAEYGARVAGKGEPVLKQVLKEGRAEGISPVGMKSVQAAEKFRQTPEYMAMMQGAGASMEPEELVGAPGAEVILSGVRPAAGTLVTGAGSVGGDSPIAEMAAPAKVVVEEAPVAVAVKAAPSALESASPATIELARKSLGHLPLEQAVALLTKKGESAPVGTTQPAAPRVAREGKISPNEFLSAMSQQQGPLASYAIDPSRSKAVSGMTFYPGGEVGVEMKSRGKPVEYAYATADPYRLTMRDYAEEGFPESMGSIAGIAANQALAHQMGLQKAVERGGTVREKRQPVYAGLMSDADIATAGMGKAARAKEQAERHFETKQIMQDLEQRAAARRAGLL